MRELFNLRKKITLQHAAHQEATHQRVQSVLPQEKCVLRAGRQSCTKCGASSPSSRSAKLPEMGSQLRDGNTNLAPWARGDGCAPTPAGRRTLARPSRWPNLRRHSVFALAKLRALMLSMCHHPRRTRWHRHESP